jgi:hypothetical protein
MKSSPPNEDPVARSSQEGLTRASAPGGLLRSSPPLQRASRSIETALAGLPEAYNEGLVELHALLNSAFYPPSSNK